MFLTRLLQSAAYQYLSVIIAIVLLGIPAAAQDRAFELWAGDVIAVSGQQNIEFPIYMRNTSDTIVGVQFWLIMSNPDLVEFTFDSIITEGMLLENWGYTISSLGGQNHDFYIVAGAGDPPSYPDAILPQDGSIPLLKIMADAYTVPDTLTDSVAVQHFIVENLSHFCFADKYGNSVGIRIDTVPDTSWWECTVWADPPNEEICLNWERISAPPADSFSIEDIVVSSLDTTIARVTDGSMIVLPCGDANCDRSVNLLDILEFIDVLYGQGKDDQFELLPAADANGDGQVNLLDILFLIDHLYGDPPGPPPICPGVY
ncbi:MAG: dockerin type I repeat-containing protein [candidate division Zixibacteria bacterium]|nr:dockerin type I repeat-containing protein [candidate division Zixibacteria bacterium]